MNRCIVTYAAGAHEELLDIALPTYRAFAHRHGYDLRVGEKLTDLPPAWNKIPLLIQALGQGYDELVWFDCDLVVVDPSEDFPPMNDDSHDNAAHSLVRHFDNYSEVPNSGVWRLNKRALPLLKMVSELEVFTNHGWYEQAALMTLMGYIVPPEGTPFADTKCRCVHPTKWYTACSFMRLCWNSHPNYRADNPKIVHCSYAKMQDRIEVMRQLVKDPAFEYPRYDEPKKEENLELPS
jgi:hypothetical protein